MTVGIAKVTRQLQFALEVDGVEYKRLEVSSPALTAPCATNRISCVSRFGHRHHPEGARGAAAAAGQVNANRKKFRGTLERPRRVAGRSSGATSRRSSLVKSQQETRSRPLQAMGFTWMNCGCAPGAHRDFRGRAGKAGQGAA